MAVKVSVDSTADLTRELYQKYDIHMFSIYVVLSGKEYKDFTEVDSFRIYEHVEKTKTLPKTAAAGIGEYLEYFRELTADGSGVVHFSLSSAISASNQNALAAVASDESLKGKVFVVDSKTLSTGTALLAIDAVEYAASGKTAAEVAARAEKRVPALCVSFVINTLEYLYKGGRCSGLAMFASQILQLKPTILLKDGKMIVGKKYMGKIEKNIVKYVHDMFALGKNPDLTRIFITHTDAPPEMVASVREAVQKAHPFAEILETRAGGVITSHCGRNTLGILYINDGGVKFE